MNPLKARIGTAHVARFDPEEHPPINTADIIFGEEHPTNITTSSTITNTIRGTAVSDFLTSNNFNIRTISSPTSNKVSFKGFTFYKDDFPSLLILLNLAETKTEKYEVLKTFEVKLMDCNQRDYIEETMFQF